MPQRLLLVAGEASGDLHGSNVARALLTQRPDLQLSGVGGSRMRAAGVDLLYDIRDLAVVGAVEAIHSVRTLWRVYQMLLHRVSCEPVDAVLLIDYPGFNLKLAKALSRRNISVFYYIAPQIWAWGPGRIRKIQRWVRKLFVILPFEARLYQHAGIEAEFVGHPLLDLVPPVHSKDAICASLGLNPSAPIVGVLPGSRRSELQYLMARMLEAAARVSSRVHDAQFILPLAETLDPAQVKDLLAAAPVPVRLVQRQTYEVMQVADVLLATSGTVTLEAALLGTPMVIVYKAHLLTYLMARTVMRTPWIGLPNIIAGRDIVPELWQYAATADAMAAHVVSLLTQPERAAAMRAELASIRGQLGSPGVSERVASGILRHLETEFTSPSAGPIAQRMAPP